VLGVAGAGTHYVWKELTNAPANVESSIISVLILFFIFDPADTWQGGIALALTAVLTISAKYVFVRHKLHLFNPVALGALLASLFSLSYATWWIGGVLFFVPVLIGGLLITQKIRRFPLVIVTVVTAYLAHLIVLFATGSFALEETWLFFLSYPILFFATVMVTEPLSTPAGRRRQLWYGACIGILSAIPFDFGFLYASLPLTLVIANSVFYPTTLRGRYTLVLKETREIAKSTYAFVFTSPRTLHFTPGQYLEWTLPHAQSDVRGIRRYFTIASSPTESEVILAARITEGASTYKQHLKSLKPGDTVTVTALSGDFILPPSMDTTPLVFIAGGIGITPFRSQIKYLIDTKVSRDTVLFYCNKTADDIAWRELWEEAKTIGVRTVHVLDTPPENWSDETGFVTGDMLRKYCNEPLTARYYISGPPGMVNGYRKMLKEIGVHDCNIVRDYFPGLA
jgi:ferredoxin-NADP reductase